MSKFEKMIHRILQNRAVSYKEAEALLKQMGFDLRIRGSHHVFGKPNYNKNISLKIRDQLLPYQIRLLQEVLKDHGY